MQVRLADEGGFMAIEHERNVSADSIDLDAYLARIGYSGCLDPTVETLWGLHFGHATCIPFENLDILLGRGIALDLKSLQAKLVERRRGGYCFEHNTLFAAVLESLGFATTRLAARVRFGSQTIRPRSHMLLSVAVDGEPWLADVGFGGGGLLYPIRLNENDDVRQGAWSYRVFAEGEVHVLQSLRPEGWFDLYAFTQEIQYPVDYIVSNHFTSTYPDSPFVRSLVAQRNGPEVRWALHDRELAEERPDGKATRTLPDDDTLLAILADIFSLRFPAGTRFHSRSAPLI
jgi:N-hydroxyarylamine O-acetyltransferase